MNSDDPPSVEQQRTETVSSLANPAWRSPHAWIRGYRMMRAAPEDFEGGLTIIDLPAARIVFLSGEFPYIDMSNVAFRFRDDGTAELDQSGLRQGKTPPGNYALFFSPCDLDDSSADTHARYRIDAAVGFAAVYLGENAVHERLFEFGLHLESGSFRGISPTAKNPFASPALNLGRDVALARSAASALASLPPDDRRRVRLAMRWHAAALHEFVAVDAVLREWLAIEILAIPSGTAVRPANQLLARHYGLSERDAAEHFGLGRLQGIRSTVVHGGSVFAVDSDLLDYVGALVGDLVDANLGQPCQRRAAARLQGRTFTDLLPTIGTDLSVIDESDDLA